MDVGGAEAAVLVVMTCDLARAERVPFTLGAVQHDGFLVEADDRLCRIKPSCVEPKHVLHSRDEFPRSGTHHIFSRPGLRSWVARTTRSVSRPALGVMPRSTARCATRGTVHRACPSGATMAARCALSRRGSGFRVARRSTPPGGHVRGSVCRRGTPLAEMCRRLSPSRERTAPHRGAPARECGATCAPTAACLSASPRARPGQLEASETLLGFHFLLRSEVDPGIKHNVISKPRSDD